MNTKLIVAFNLLTLGIGYAFLLSTQSCGRRSNNDNDRPGHHYSHDAYMMRNIQVYSPYEAIHILNEARRLGNLSDYHKVRWNLYSGQHLFTSIVSTNNTYWLKR